ncbi:MAG: SpvB/TcaC N-terminal domain-containing protein [Ardenticatenaceae bacterium]
MMKSPKGTFFNCLKIKITSRKINAIPPTLPKGCGTIQAIGETFSANEFTGTAALSIPIKLTASRDLMPPLSVDYSFGGGNGIFGLGFETTPEIARQPVKGIPKYNLRDTFLFRGKMIGHLRYAPTRSLASKQAPNALPRLDSKQAPPRASAARPSTLSCLEISPDCPPLPQARQEGKGVIDALLPRNKP